MCEYERALRPQYPGGKSLYITSLEERIAFLESQLPDYAEDHFEHAQAAVDEGHEPATEINQANPASRQRATSAGSQNSPDADDGSSLVDGVAYLSLYASGASDSAPEPYYLGSSSGATIARFIQSSVFRGSYSASPQQTWSSDATQHPAGSGARNISPSRTTQPVLDFPERDIARLLFDVFFDRVHTRWPLLDRGVYTVLFDKQYVPGGLSVTESSIFHLIYAITTRFLSLTGKPCSIDSEQHLVAATQQMDLILEQHSLATIQILLLLGVHGQRSPYGAGAWAQIRYATSMCIEMGLHRRRVRSSTREQTSEEELRRRAFWCCYSLDRSIGVVLGRPFAIADRDINAELPSLDAAFATLTHADTSSTDITRWSNIAPFVHIIKLERILSRIHKTVFRVDQDVLNTTPESQAKLDRKMAGLRDDLDHWLRDCPRTPKDLNRSTWMYDPENAYLDASDFYGLQYHKAVLFLYTIFLPSLKPSDARFPTCFRSAAAVCIAYKRLNQNRTLTYTMISLHSAFTAGLTLVFCLWRDRSMLSFEAFEAIRACSQSLTIFGEKWAGAIKYRDIFDALSDSLFKTVMNPSGSTSHPSGTHATLVQGAVIRHPTTVPRQQYSGTQHPQSTDGDGQDMAQMMSDAVKEAFMEVDEEAPGGWQGWRMWNEMAGNAVPAQPDQEQTSRFGDSEDFASARDWSMPAEMGAFGIDPMQDPDSTFGTQSTQWNFNVFR